MRPHRRSGNGADTVTQARHVLVADDEPNMRRVLAAMLEGEGLAVRAARDGAEAAAAIGERPFDLIITDLRMGGIGGIDGMELLRHVQQVAPRTPVVMITAHGSVDTAVEAMKSGAFDFVTKPFEQAEIKSIVAKALRTAELDSGAGRAAAEQGDEHGAYGMIGASAAMKTVFEVIGKVADTPSTVLITGESGTGKELVARALHERSIRAAKPFIKINCAAIPATLVESELFGHEKGAFTGAVSTKPGRFELADGGTLFLDEVGEVPLEMQVKLLRVLQEAEFERVGGVRTLKVDTRLVAATNADLDKSIAEGRFREDLFYRLNVVPLALPPLRDRREDIALLAQHFLRHFNSGLRKSVQGFTPEALTRLTTFRWPGNIRQLENVIERTLLFCDADEIGVSDLPPEVSASKGADAALDALDAGAVAAEALAEGTGLKDVVRETTSGVERTLIQQALEQTGGNVTQAAKKLQISRKSMQIKMKELGLREGPGGKRA